MKKLLLILTVALLSAVAFPAAAACTTAPIMTVETGAVGSQSAYPPNAEYVNQAQPWTATTEPYSFGAFTNYGGPKKISFGSGSAVEVRFGPQCYLSDGACVTTLPAGRFTTLRLDNVLGSDGANNVRVKVDSYKVMEFHGVYTVSSLQNTTTWSDGIAKVRQDTGSNSRLFFEGYDVVGGVATWKSIGSSFGNDCGRIALNYRQQREQWASLGFIVIEPVTPKQWWEALG